VSRSLNRCPVRLEREYLGSSIILDESTGSGGFGLEFMKDASGKAEGY
jgi:hypothetical protein